MQIDPFQVRSFPSIDTVGTETGRWPVRVCIVTEEIIGPVRNGGIASTYYHLSKGLAAHGHDVHVLFLKGRQVQDKNPEHWVEHFASFGVTLHYLEEATEPKLGAAVGWQARYMAAYRWLRDAEPFDVVHTSEWRGGAIYALMAKRMGLAFPQTLFLVKTSSPHIWNRHYQMQPIEQDNLVAAAYAERKCVELADMVIGGSAHLITFMGEIGYRLPLANVFVQPNIVDFSNVPVEDQRGPRAPGDVVRTRELIFFGRLEGRKGVEIFANAIDLLHDRDLVPDRITFMGKWGAALATQSGIPVQDYLADKAAHWSCPVEYITDLNQPEALSHMCSRDMIAVMPSLIENSTMAVYETLEKRIPFIATAVGGTPELIDPADHATSLVAPTAMDLARRLEEALRDGQPIAHPGFSNDANLETWYGFHAWLGRKIAEEGRGPVMARLCAPVNPETQPLDTLGYGALMRPGDDAEAWATALLADPPDRVILAVTEARLRAPAEAALTILIQAGIAAEKLDCIGRTAGGALHALAEGLGTDALVLSDGLQVTPRPGYMAAARTALAQRPDCMFTTFYQTLNGAIGMPLGGDVASQFDTSLAYGPELIALRADTYARLGAVEPYDVRHGLLHELVTRHTLQGPDDLLVYPEPLLHWPVGQRELPEMARNAVQSYLRAKPLIDTASLPLRKLLLRALGKTRVPNLAGLRDSARKPGTPLWLIPADWNRHRADPVRGHFLHVALDDATGRIWLMARGPGKPVLHIDDIPVDIQPQASHVTLEGEALQLFSWDIPLDKPMIRPLPLLWALEDDNGTVLRARFVRISPVGNSVLALTSTAPVLTPRVLHQLINDQTIPPSWKDNLPEGLRGPLRRMRRTLSGR